MTDIGWKKRRTPDHAGLRLAQKMLRVRTDRGESQLNFARRFEISIGTYGRWERYGPPRHVAIREYVRHKLRNLDDWRKKHGQV